LNNANKIKTNFNINANKFESMITRTAQRFVNKELKLIIENIKLSFNLRQEEIAARLGIGESYLSSVINGTHPLTESLKEKINSEFNISFKEVSENVKNVNSEDTIPMFSDIVKTFNYIFLLPLSAYGGSLNSFTMSLKEYDCEKIISPIKDAEFALTIAGESMSPEYPAGCQILIKKIDENNFLEWGRVHVLDTANGIVVKIINRGSDSNHIRCTSINPDQERYQPFEIPVDCIFGFYRVLFVMAIK
jgi:transcriptional regulator with XRE-family HTH domain